MVLSNLKRNVLHPNVACFYNVVVRSCLPYFTTLAAVPKICDPRYRHGGAEDRRSETATLAFEYTREDVLV